MLPFALLSLWTGTTKSISVCGMNGAAAARPMGSVRWGGVTGYFVGLLLGASLLVSAAIAAGTILSAVLPDQVAVPAAGALLVALGSLELLRGDGALPHIAWAVPRTWIRWPLGLAWFGFIREWPSSTIHRSHPCTRGLPCSSFCRRSSISSRPPRCLPWA